MTGRQAVQNSYGRITHLDQRGRPIAGQDRWLNVKDVTIMQSSYNNMNDIKLFKEEFGWLDGERKNYRAPLDWDLVTKSISLIGHMDDGDGGYEEISITCETLREAAEQVAAWEESTQFLSYEAFIETSFGEAYLENTLDLDVTGVWIREEDTSDYAWIASTNPPTYKIVASGNSSSFCTPNTPVYRVNP